MNTGRQKKGGIIPEPSDIGQVFQNHHTHFSNLSGEEVLQQMGGEKGIAKEYSGRILFELLQNALDRAKSKIHVKLVETPTKEQDYALVVSNDGAGFRVDPEYDYENPPERSGEKRPDFNSLCSLHLSNKSADDSVGNKGIGFRSVFAAGDYVRVWSRYNESPGLWGLEMHLPISKKIWERRYENPEITRGFELIRAKQEIPLKDGETRPSFHFPLPLKSETIPSVLADIDTFTTAVVVPVNEEHIKTIRQSIEEMRSRHLYFVGLFDDRRDISVQFSTPDDSFVRSTWPETASNSSRGKIVHWNTSSLEALALEADHEVSEPGAAIAWPPRSQSNSSGYDGDVTPGVYGYLPTKMDSPFGIDIQGDFELGIDRTGLDVEEGITGPYNRKLLKISAEIHLLEILHQLGLPSNTFSWEIITPHEVQTISSDHTRSPRADLWTLLDPSSGTSKASDVIIEHVESLVFSSGDDREIETYEHWAAFANEFFDGTERPLESYHEFWNATDAWIHKISPHSDRSNYWADVATAVCDAVRATEAPVVPVETSDVDEQSGTAAVPLPERGQEFSGGQNQRHSRTVFLRSGDEKSLPLPEALRQANRAVTSFQFPSSILSATPQPLGTDPFNRWEVLSQLRQLPNSLPNRTDGHPPLAEDPDEAAMLQQGLIRYAAELYSYKSKRGKANPSQSDTFCHGWRELNNEAIGDNAQQAGRSIATLFLPTTDGLWEPARQLTRDQVNDDQLGELPDAVDVDSFLSFLGVAPRRESGPPLTLLEGGPKGIVDSRDRPPQLEDAGPGVSSLSLGLLPMSDTDEYDPVDWQTALEEAWDTWLGELLAAEIEERAETESNKSTKNLQRPLAKRPWYPVDVDGSMATSPDVLSTGRDAIAPRQLTLLSYRQQKFPTILWSVDKRTSDIDLLTALGAITGIDADDLERENATPAFRLIDQLQELNLTAIEENPTARQALVNLYDRILKSIVDTDHTAHELDDLALLCYEPVPTQKALTNRSLSWHSIESDEAWIVPDTSARESMRRFFPNERLIVARIGPTNLSNYPPLADRGVNIQRTISSDSLTESDPTLAQKVDEHIDPLIPTLLALCQSALQADVDPVTHADRWRRHDFQHVDNAWVTYKATLGETEAVTEQWLKETSNNALYKKGDSLQILFDTARETTNQLPPLAEFGEPLAALLFEDRRQDVGSLFARALSEYDRDDRDDGQRRLDRFVKKSDAGPLVEEFERQFHPLSDDAATDLINKTQQALNNLGLELREGSQSVPRLPNLGPGDITFEDATGELSESGINDELEALDISESQTHFAPTFSCKDIHLEEWENWFNSHDERLVPYLVDLCQSHGHPDIEAEDVTNKLTKVAVREQCAKLLFDPSTTVVEWLQTQSIPNTTIPDPAELLTEVRQFAPRYKTVHTVTELPDGWSRGTVSKPTPSEIERGTVEVSDVAKTMRAQGAVGQEAELAFRHEVAQTTATHFQQADETDSIDEAVETLLQPLPSGGKTEANLQSAIETWRGSRNHEDLASGLHISSVWDGAGYDLLGLEQSNDELCATRYEVKALPEEGSRIKLYLSSNEIAVYRDVCLKPDTIEEPKYTGDWQLIGVEPDGQAINLSAELVDLTDLLGPLRSAGFDHDGIVLYVDRPQQ